MKRVKQSYGVEIEEVSDFLTSSGWIEKRRTSSLIFYSPPQSLGIKGEYTIALPIDPSRPGTDAFMVQAIGALEDLYGFRFVRLKNRLATKSEFSGPAQFNVRFIGAQTIDGSMPLPALKTFLEYIQKGLYQAAKFKLDGSSHGPSNAAATHFAQECRFLQTQHGSFIARIEVPFGWLQQGDLFRDAETSTHDVCSSLHSVVQFINDRILNSDEPFNSETAISEAVSLFDPELLETLARMLVGPDVDSVEVVMEVGSQRRVSTTGVIDEARKQRLYDYVEFVKRHFYGDDAINVTGQIVELRSRDPDGNKNHVRIVADHFGDRTYLSATLTNDQYALAVNAHRAKQAVRIRGSGVRLKTQIRIDRVASFDVAG